jgi:hypothetical protein
LNVASRVATFPAPSVAVSWIRCRPLFRRCTLIRRLTECPRLLATTLRSSLRVSERSGSVLVARPRTMNGLDAHLREMPDRIAWSVVTPGTRENTAIDPLNDATYTD